MTQPDSSNRFFTSGMTVTPTFSPYMGQIWEGPGALATSDRSTQAHLTQEISSPRANHSLPVKHSRTVHTPLPVSSPPLLVPSPPLPPLSVMSSVGSATNGESGCDSDLIDWDIPLRSEDDEELALRIMLAGSCVDRGGSLSSTRPLSLSTTMRTTTPGPRALLCASACSFH